ncbi:hypothetical protein OCU04_001713 [Sclerotinia nivalis]|uniref:Uncharacterized protein n=1 Tax=Sclerotinia nivalis TaxID=352851 RepID=A0A9X0AYP8_9HELO|nr:hypothetical protein OCU04_001713 [Sclerotinia nivalis]
MLLTSVKILAKFELGSCLRCIRRQTRIDFSSRNDPHRNTGKERGQKKKLKRPSSTYPTSHSPPISNYPRKKFRNETTLRESNTLGIALRTFPNERKLIS